MKAQRVQHQPCDIGKEDYRGDERIIAHTSFGCKKSQGMRMSRNEAEDERTTWNKGQEELIDVLYRRAVEVHVHIRQQGHR